MEKRRPLPQNANEANPVACSNGNLHPGLQEQTQIPKSPLAQIQLPATQLSDPNRTNSSATTPMAKSFNANTEVSGLKVSDILLLHPSLPNSLCLGPRSTESPAHLISCEANRIPFVNQDLDLSTWADCLRAWPNPPEDWRCYSFFDALVIPIPQNLSFTSSTDDFDAWWGMWKTHVFRRALGPLLKQLDAEYNIPAEQTSTEEICSEDTQSGREESSSGTSGKNTAPSEPDLPPSASKKRSASQVTPAAGEGSRRIKSRCMKRARKTPQTSSSDQEPSNTDDTSSGEVKEVMMPSTTLDLAASNSGAEKAATLVTPSAEAREPITSSPAAPMVSGEGYDLSNLLTFDPESIEPTAKASEAPGPNATQGEALARGDFVAYRSRVTLARQRIGLRHAQLSLKADIADKCRRLNKKKAALDAKTDTSPSSAELEILRKELKDLEERVRVTKQLIQDKEALIARSNEEAEDLKAELKTDLAEIRALNKQLVMGQDEDDEAEIAEVDCIRASALCALEAFLQ
ncbi:hypothetical protein QYE76_052159 [Lolium multiflorum]|uniref:Uncharacterized protein n=1 Tax=Lolium multiflorum TaxID=4521 RepID=A0AAD8WL98_LOLMU|nr:hypothetical protein QYE76_052159 [Lolium multiflorum]